MLGLLLMGIEAKSETIRYAYDAQHQLTRVAYTQGALIYRYDKAHNLRYVHAYSDTDTDQLPDDWERVHWGKLSEVRFNTDHDEDGLSDGEEYLSGSDPTNAFSSLKMLPMSEAQGQGIRLSWASETNKRYRIERSTNLLSGVLVVVHEQIEATPPVNVFVDMSATDEGPWFYRIEVE